MGMRYENNAAVHQTQMSASLDWPIADGMEVALQFYAADASMRYDAC